MKANLTKIVDFFPSELFVCLFVEIIIVMSRTSGSREVSSYTGIYQLISTHHHQEVSPCE